MYTLNYNNIRKNMFTIDTPYITTAELPLLNTSGTQIDFTTIASVYCPRLLLFYHMLNSNVAITSTTTNTRDYAYYADEGFIHCEADIVIGSNASAQPTYTDYTLSGTLITTFDVIQTSMADVSGRTCITRTYANNTASPITVNEIALLVRIPTSSLGSGVSSVTFTPTLLAREIITPVTVPAGDFFQVMIAI